MTWVEDATKNEDKQCLRRDITEVDVSSRGCGKNMLDICCDLTLYNEYIVIVETGNECQLTDYMSSHKKNCCGGLLRASVVPAKFLLVLLDHVACGRRDIQRVGCGMVWERSTLRITVRDTAQTERMRLVNTSSLDSRLHQSRKRVFPRHPCFEPVLSCCLCQCCTQNSLFLQSPYFAHGNGAPGFSVLIHGSTTCRQLKSCLRDWSISRMKPCRQDNDKGQRNKRWRPNNVSSSYPQEAVHPPRQLESSTRALWASRRRSRVSHRNGQPGNSRSRRLRVRRIQE